MCWFPICYFSMSEQWFSASEEVDSGSDSDQEERRGLGLCPEEGGRSGQVTVPPRWEETPPTWGKVIPY